jgi:hypothetical protein
MKCLFFLIALLPTLSSAAVINYKAENGLLWNGFTDTPASLSLSFDTKTESFTSFSLTATGISANLISSEPFAWEIGNMPYWNWSGAARLTIEIIESGVSRIVTGTTLIELSGAPANTMPIDFFNIYSSLTFDIGFDSYSTIAVMDKQAASVPEPSTLALLGLGLAGLVRFRRQQMPNLI